MRFKYAVLRRLLPRISLVLLALLLAGTGLCALVYLAALRKLDETLQGRPWDVPSRLYPASLELRPKKRLPPGSIESVLEGMGYRRAARVRTAGEYRHAGDGRYFVRPLAGWPSLDAYVDDTLELTVKDGVVAAVKVYQGQPLPRAVLPPAPFAEIRAADQESRKLVKMTDVPKVLADAVLAIEDKRFREHFGLDLRGLVRAVVVNVLQRERAQGGSTITQQLAKNYFLSHEKTLVRKLREAFFALALEEKLSKDQILELYLNEIYLGQRGSVAICGVGQAAWMLFSKQVEDLSLAESALIAGLIQAPNSYAPERHPERARTRRDVVLRAMLDQGRITEAAHNVAHSQAITLRPGAGATRAAPYFVDHVAEQLAAAFPSTSFSAEGFVLETTLDMRVQRAAEQGLTAHLGALQKKSKVPLEGAVVAIEPRTGRILAMVGGRDYGLSQFNRATLARRQPGSVFKPLVILAALHASGTRLQPATLLDDEPLSVRIDGRTWSPHNSNNKFHGQVTLRETIEQSLNVPTVRLALDVGLEEIVATLSMLPLSTTLKPVPSLALGVFEATPIQIASAYTALATDGVVHAPYAIRRVVAPDGKILFEGKPDEVSLVSSAEAFLVRDMMRGVLDFGTAKSARDLGYAHAASGKTGTTNDGRDAWFAGFDGELLVVVWVGSDEALPTRLSGARAALPVWVHVMKSVRGSQPPPADPVPAGLVATRICAETHKRASDRCPAVEREVFFAGHEPVEACPRHANLIEAIGSALFQQLPRHLKDIFAGIQD